MSFLAIFNKANNVHGLSKEIGMIPKEALTNILADNPKLIERDLTLFDRDVPSLLRETIDLLCLNENRRLVLVQITADKLANDEAIAFFKKLIYLWHWICDFKDDFIIEVERKTSSSALRMPPELVIIVLEPSDHFLRLAAHFKRQVIDLRVFLCQILKPDGSGQNEEKADGAFSTGHAPACGEGISLALKKIKLPRSSPLRLEELGDFTADLIAREEAQQRLWEDISAINPKVCGYSLDRKAMALTESISSKSTLSKTD